MPCFAIPRRRRAAFTWRAARGAAPLLILGASAAALAAQQPADTAHPPASSSAHPPVIALASPSSDGSVPANRPVVVFHFAPGDSADAIDPATLRVWVDGEDRSSLFQREGSAASGPLAPSGMRPGVHLVTAQICSARGLCAGVQAPVLVAAANDSVSRPSPDSAAVSPAGAQAAAVPHGSWVRRLVCAIGAVLTRLVRHD